MVIDDFIAFANTVIDSEFPVKVLPNFYCNSIKLQIDEINSEKHLQMFFEEFIEGMCRVIDKLSPIPEADDPLDWSQQDKQDQHLSEKIVNILPKLTKIIKEEYKQIREKFVYPKKDDDGYYTYDLSSQFYNIFPKGLHK